MFDLIDATNKRTADEQENTCCFYNKPKIMERSLSPCTQLVQYILFHAIDLNTGTSKTYLHVILQGDEHEEYTLFLPHASAE